ncbi:MAG: hypothetical protein COT74_08190 [Bdellovibrionales bacterium CG10_big_fil_rev_8_21_14_0_10_45_34]|nr:MAG: hypothetical protein COT74_08190 [Bdellovibrionales bacterium CG10_big_fil_rev_8_21_14_0_10_45_34]
MNLFTFLPFDGSLRQRQGAAELSFASECLHSDSPLLKLLVPAPDNSTVQASHPNRDSPLSKIHASYRMTSQNEFQSLQ